MVDHDPFQKRSPPDRLSRVDTTIARMGPQADRPCSADWFSVAQRLLLLRFLPITQPRQVGFGRTDGPGRDPLQLPVAPASLNRSLRRLLGSPLPDGAGDLVLL